MAANQPDFSFIDHTADLGIIVRGNSLEDLFEAAAKSMIRIMVKSEFSETVQNSRLCVDGEDLDDLMVRWLGEILYLFEGENKLITDVLIDSISPSHLEATLDMVPFNPNIHEILCEIKAVTYHQIQVVKKDRRWEARIIFDL